MCKIIDVGKLREHNNSSLVITLTKAAQKMGFSEGDYLKIVEKDEKIQLIPVEESEDEEK